MGKSEGKRVKFRSNLMGGFNKADVITYIAQQNREQLTEMESLRASLAASENACADAEEKLDAVSGGLAETNQLLEKSRAEAAELRAALAETQKKVQECADKAAEAERRADEAEEALKTAQQAVRQSEARLTEAADKVAALEKSSGEIDQLRRTVSEQAQRIESLEFEKADADERLQMLMTGLQNVAGEYDFTVGGAPAEDPRIEELTKRVEELTAENDQLKSSLEKVNGFRSAIRSMLNTSK